MAMTQWSRCSVRRTVAARARMFADVAERLLHDAEGRLLDAGGSRSLAAPAAPDDIAMGSVSRN